VNYDTAGSVTLSRLSVEQTIRLLEQRRHTMGCAEICRLLADLGYKVTSGRAGHKQYTHPMIPTWHGSNFDCGHENHLKGPYVGNIRRVISDHLPILKNLRGEK